MKRTNKFVSFLSGMLTALLLVGMAAPALAAGFSKYIEVSTGVSLYMDDTKLDPRDANGNPVEVFIYNGTTYLPVRAISEALEIPVQWDGSTRSVYVGKHTGNKPAVWLADMDYFLGTENLSKANTAKDNTGETHVHCIMRGFTRKYMLNGNYSRLTGTLFQKYEYRSDSLFSEKPGMAIYADGELVYEYGFAKGDTGIKPVNFDIDLTGVLELEVSFGDGGDSYGLSACLALGDVGLWT